MIAGAFLFQLVNYQAKQIAPLFPPPKNRDHPDAEIWIGIHCICGNRYDTFAGYYANKLPMRKPGDPPREQYRYHGCPNCGHIWNLVPK
jgi:hypothetical protein